MPAVILHDNGRARLFADRRRLIPNMGPVYCRLLEQSILDRGHHPEGFGPVSSEVDLVLCSTRQEPQYSEKILDDLGVTEYTVLGRHLQEWRHIYKIQLILERIADKPEPETLMYLDATDVLITGSIHRAPNTFQNEHRCELLFGAEKASAPGSKTAKGITAFERQFIRRIEDFETSTYGGPFHHLNAGCFIGDKAAIRELFQLALELRRKIPVTSVLSNGNHLAEDDQLLFRELHRLHYPRIQIDHRCLVFQNLFGIRRSELSTGWPAPPRRKILVEFMRRALLIFVNRATGPLRS